MRVPILYADDQRDVSESALTDLFRVVKNHEKIVKVDNVQKRYPLHCMDAAKFLSALSKKIFEVVLF